MPEPEEVSIRATVWNEYRVERELDEVAAHYPAGLHQPLVAALEGEGIEARVALLDEPDQGLPDTVLRETDVLLWWGHEAHDEVSDGLAQRIVARVHEGMGFVALHSAHFSKPFLGLHGTSGRLRWRLDDVERLWVVEPGHPIAAGLPEVIVLDPEEMYGERFDVPPPDDLVAISSFGGGEVFRSVCTWRHGRGRVVYLRPGEERYPTYHHPDIRRLVANAARWAAGGDGPGAS